MLRPTSSSAQKAAPFSSNHTALRQHLIEQLPHSPLRFQNRITMIHRSCKVGICKGNPSKRSVPQNLARCGPAIAAKEEPRLRTEIGVPPAIQDDPRDVPPRVKACAVKHLAELFAESPLIV